MADKLCGGKVLKDTLRSEDVKTLLNWIQRLKMDTSNHNLYREKMTGFFTIECPCDKPSFIVKRIVLLDEFDSFVKSSFGGGK